MGYQESYISTKNNKDLEKILDIFKKYNIRCEKDLFASCVAKITLKKDISSIGDNAKSFKEGKEFLYICGDRSAQRRNSDLFDIESDSDYQAFSLEEKRIIDDIDIIFTEDMPSKLIFNEDSGYAIVEDINLSSI